MSNISHGVSTLTNFGVYFKKINASELTNTTVSFTITPRFVVSNSPTGSVVAHTELPFTTLKTAPNFTAFISTSPNVGILLSTPYSDITLATTTQQTHNDSNTVKYTEDRPGGTVSSYVSISTTTTTFITPIYRPTAATANVPTIKTPSKTKFTTMATTSTTPITHFTATIAIQNTITKTTTTKTTTTTTAPQITRTAVTQPCAMGIHNCDTNSFCTNDGNVRTCTCKPGYDKTVSP